MRALVVAAGVVAVLVAAWPAHASHKDWTRQLPWRIEEAKVQRVRAWSCESSAGLSRSAYPAVRWNLPVQQRRFHTLSYWRSRLNQCRARVNASPVTVICIVFGPYCQQAIAVSRCETGGTFSVYAHNGQYLGLFQMGANERRTYGHGWDPWTQARAAYRYFVASGRDWSPWECKP